MTTPTPLRALALVCSLKPSPARSSSELLDRQVVDALGKHGVSGDVVRVLDHDVKPGVELDQGDGDAWPDAELSEKDDDGRLDTYGKVAVAAVVGNEDGAHKISACSRRSTTSGSAWRRAR